MVVNLDETSLERLIPHRRGHVLPVGSRGQASSHLYERIARRDSHGHVTLVAVVCGEPGLQAHMPQLVLTRDAALTVAERAALRDLRPPLAWLRGTGGWVTAENFKTILTLLRRAIHRQRPGVQVVVCCDSASQHVADAVIRHSQCLRMHLLCVPGRLTWLLQPLDSHVFGRLKRHLHALQIEARVASDTGVLAPTRWIQLLEQAVHHVLVQQDWTHAVRANGLTGDTHALRARVAEQLLGAFPLPLRRPSDATLALVLGRQRVGLAERITRAGERFRAQHAAAALPAPAPGMLA